jgi:hypothetical protein
MLGLQPYFAPKSTKNRRLTAFDMNYQRVMPGGEPLVGSKLSHKKVRIEG